MCGIYGMVSLRGEPLCSPGILEAMGRSLRHRGPDGHGVILRRHFGLGCERLRVMDLRKRADQPFGDPDDGCCMACNGEIYNADELRRRYSDYPFRSRSDVEVIVPLYRDRGTEGIRDLDGMFGLAIWDQASRALTLARDRAGEKPLFYFRSDGELWFASEIQTLLLHPGISRDLDREAIAQYLTLGYVPEPRTAFRDIRKIEAGTSVTFTADRAVVSRYWQPGAFEAVAEPAEQAAARLRSLFAAAVRKQIVADVPVGIFLSGGIDSALVAAVVAREAPELQPHTFTARFSDPSYDEGPAAAAAAGLVGTRHHEVVIGEPELLEAHRAVADRLAEPLADPAILPTYLLAREARKHVTVVLSGEGADELFGGYPTYLGHSLVSYVQALPEPLRKMLRGAVGMIPASRGKVTLEFLLKRFLAGADKPLLERHLAWFGMGARHLLAGNGLPAESGLDFPAAEGLPDRLGGAMLLDYRSYLADGLLTKNDRATMLNSLEARAPFLDRELSAFAMTVPDRFKVRRLTTKWLLKKAACEWLPKKAVYRRKRGLSVPVASWLDNSLRSEVDRLLAAERLGRQDLFDPQGVGQLLAEHRAKKANHARPLWALVVFQYWLERWVPDRAG